MDFGLPDQTRQIQRSIREWAVSRVAWRADNHLFDRARWQELVDLGVLTAEQDGGTVLDTVVALLEAAGAGMPGPIVEAYLAGAAGHPVADGSVVTSVWPGSPSARGGGMLVGWGAVADVVVDAASGAVLAEEALPAVKLTYPLPHGWLAADPAPAPATETRRWLAAAATVAGLADAAVAQTVEHAKARHQFGKPLGAFQAVQTRLVESALAVRTLRTAVLDAASRLAAGRSDADTATAIAWLAAHRTSRVVERNCHQVHGATGFALETGLVGLTWPLWWVRESTGRASAVAFLRTQLRREMHRPALVRECFGA